MPTEQQREVIGPLCNGAFGAGALLGAAIWGAVVGLVCPSIARAEEAMIQARAYCFVLGLTGPVGLIVAVFVLVGIVYGICQSCIFMRDFCNVNRPIVVAAPPEQELNGYAWPGPGRQMA